MVLVLLLEESVRAGALPHLLLDFLRKVVLLLLGFLQMVVLLHLVEGLRDRVLWLNVMLRRLGPSRGRLWGRWAQIEGL